MFFNLRQDIFYIGITGTVGKTESCMLLNHIMSDVYSVSLCGNIGIPVFDYIETNKKILIIELSSFMLEYTYSFKPNIFIILNISNHHLDYHKTFNNYLLSKVKCSYNQTSSDILIIPSHLNDMIDSSKLLCKLHSKKIVIDDKNIDLSLYKNINYFRIDSNYQNFCYLYYVLKFFKLHDDYIIEKIKTFSRPKLRYEIIYESSNLVIINDSKSTCLKSLKSSLNITTKLYKDYHLILLIGGKIDEGIKDELLDLSNHNIDHVLIFGENKNLLKNIVKLNSNNIYLFNSLEEVIDFIRSSIDHKNNNVILFSPGSQSLDMFESYIERGKVFNKLIIQILE